MGYQKVSDSIPGRTAAFTEGTLSRVSGMAMECGMTQGRVESATRDTTCSIRSMAMECTIGQTGTCIRAASSRINAADRGNSSITMP